MVILQETCRDGSGALIVYAPVDIPAMQQVISGGDTDYVALLPSGFCILPDMATPIERREMLADYPEGPPISESGTLLTVAFQILVTAGVHVSAMGLYRFENHVPGFLLCLIRWKEGEAIRWLTVTCVTEMTHDFVESWVVGNLYRVGASTCVAF